MRLKNAYDYPGGILRQVTKTSEPHGPPSDGGDISLGLSAALTPLARKADTAVRKAVFSTFRRT